MRRRLPFVVLVLVSLALPACTVPVGAGNQPTKQAVAVKKPATAPAAASHARAHRRRPKPLPPRFYGRVLPFTHAFAMQLKQTTWHPGCPVRLRDLRLLTMRYWGFDHRVHQGYMEINEAVAHDVVTVFQKLFQARFPIADMQVANRYVPGVRDDPRSKADFTNGFNCRPVVTAVGAAPRWSMHSYGLAIDVNQMQNPYVTSSGFVYDVFARRYRNRSLHLPGMIHPGDVVVRAFQSIGWHWGGDWTPDKDYMHFSVNGH